MKHDQQMQLMMLVIVAIVAIIAVSLILLTGHDQMATGSAYATISQQAELPHDQATEGWISCLVKGWNWCNDWESGGCDMDCYDTNGNPTGCGDCGDMGNTCRVGVSQDCTSRYFSNAY